MLLVLGMLGMDNQQAIDESRKRDEALMDTGAGIAGNIAGNVASLAPAALIPGAGTLAGGAAIGALSGSLTPTSGDESRLGSENRQ